MISRLVNVLLKPSTSAPPPSPVDADCLAILSAIFPVTFCSILFPILSPANLAKKNDPKYAGIATNNNSVTNCPNIFALDIPIDNNTAISFFLAFIHKNNNKATTKPANARDPINNLSAIAYIPLIDSCNAG